MMESSNISSEDPGTCSTMESVKESTGCEEVQGILKTNDDSKTNGIKLVHGEEHTPLATEQIVATEEPNVTEKTITEEVIAVTDPTPAAVTEVEVSGVIETVHTTSSNNNSGTMCEIPLQNAVQSVSNEIIKQDPENPVPKVEFETEILVEYNDNVPDLSNQSMNNDSVMNELDHNLEFSDAVNSADVSDNIENNNDSSKQEVFNKEELIHILEGNDSTPLPESQKKEFLVAVEQLAKLRMDRKTRCKQVTKKIVKDAVKLENSSPSTDVSYIVASEVTATEGQAAKNLALIKRNLADDDKQSEKSKDSKPLPKRKIIDRSDHEKPKTKVTTNQKQPVSQSTKEKSQENIISALVMDWDDDEDKAIETPEADDQKASLETAEKKVPVEQNKDSKESNSKQTLESTSTDETQPQRRLGRVIKKKVIFDPDNPDTFTKGKAVSKTKSDKDVPEKDHPPVKKSKVDQNVRADSKSPTGKSPWKKPQPKQSKQNKRLSEVDKLLMDEGAVNMIYQLTPEAPKGKKNMRTKAEIIKKLQCSTPDSNEMKFRERKKESIKLEDGEPKKILVGKQRMSLSSSVKSPCISEDFENHSADDSIIYRRHSSSSYESNCMSPRRLSDMEHSMAVVSQPPESQNEVVISQSDTENETIIFTSAMEPKRENEFENMEVSNKSTGSSIKAKLSSKLNNLLSKKKQDKGHKLVVENLGKNIIDKSKFKFRHLRLMISKQMAEIHITSNSHNPKVLNEITDALKFVDGMSSVSVTVLTSLSGTLCSEVDLVPLLNQSLEDRTESGYQLAESIKCLLVAIHQHRKLLICGVWGHCTGLAIPILSLCDFAFATDTASFKLDASDKGVPQPGTAVLNLRSPPLPHSLVMDIVILNRVIGTAEGVSRGLLHDKLWSADHLKSIAQDIASQPIQALKLKKKLLRCSMTEDYQITFQKSLDVERDNLVQYWTSVEGQELLRGIYGKE